MTIVTRRTWIMIFCCACIGAAGVRPSSTRAAVTATADDSLYLRLGGEQGVAAIANTLIDRVVENPVTGPNFKDSKIDRIKRLLAEQICDLSGGPCHYSGDPMKEVHAGHQISESMFYIMVSTLRDVMKERHIDERSRNQLLRLLAPMKRDVVEHASNKPPVPAPRAASAAQ
jgi:hemoglobin